MDRSSDSLRQGQPVHVRHGSKMARSKRLGRVESGSSNSKASCAEAATVGSAPQVRRCSSGSRGWRVCRRRGDSLVQQRLLSDRFLARSRRGLPFESAVNQRWSLVPPALPPICPCMSVTSSLTIVRPRPVPPKRLVVVPSAWERPQKYADGLQPECRRRNLSPRIEGDGLVRLSQRKDSHVDLAFCGEL